MKLVKHTTAITLLILLFVGNVGINVFKHVCEEDGVMVSYVFDGGDDHCDDHMAEKDLPSCCEEDEPEDEGCCNDEVEYFKLKVDAHSVSSNEDQVTNSVAVLNSPFEFHSQIGQYDYYTSNYVNPPPPDSREILTQKQVWII